MKLAEHLKSLLTGWLMRDHGRNDQLLCDFQRIQLELRPGDVILLEGRSRVSDIIRTITHSTWTHSALYIGRLHDIENPVLRNRVLDYYPAKPDEQLLIESWLGKGTIISPLSNYKNDHIRLCRPMSLNRRDIQQVIGYAISKLGMDYDVRQIVDLARLLLPWSFLPGRWRSTLFETNAGRPTKEICSTLLAEAFSSVQYPILPLVKKDPNKSLEIVQRNPRLFTPKDFDYSPYFEIIKYPMFDLSVDDAHRQLPWSQDGIYSNDEHGFVNEDEKIAEEKAFNEQQKLSGEHLTGPKSNPQSFENTPSKKSRFFRFRRRKQH